MIMGSRSEIEKPKWLSSSIHNYWGEVAAARHVVQVYESDLVLLDSLEGFARSGLTAGESVILIARRSLLNDVAARLEMFGFDIGTLRFNAQLVFLDAAETLALFMEGNTPDRDLFNQHIGTLVDHARGPAKRNVRAYGEMVSILWQEDKIDATMALEELWNDFCAANSLTLFCAYPKNIFSEPQKNLPAICKCHHHLLNGASGLRLHVHYTLS
jgi:hypothetical protein